MAREVEEVGEIHLYGPGGPRYFRDGREYHSVGELQYFLEGLRKARMEGRLRLYVEGFRRRLKRNPSPEDLERGMEGLFELEHRSLPIGILEVRDGRIFLGDFEVDWRELEGWIRVCLLGFWELTPERAWELARFILSSKKEAEERALRTLREVLGEELTEKLLSEGKILVKAANGREYLLTKNGEVLSPDGRERFCVQVKGGEKLPTYDLVLAKYLAIRDRPESISTLRRRRNWWEGRLRMLVHELEMLMFRMDEEGEEDEGLEDMVW